MRALLWLALVAAPTAWAADPATPAADNPLDEIPLDRIDGVPLDRSVIDDKVVLFVNVASKCGYTPQYEGLQALYRAHEHDDFVIVGVPCNQFMGQEPGDAEDIVTFCSGEYGVTFPLLTKQDVNGPRRSPLYRYLVSSDAGGGKKIGWNFEKFLVDRNGQVLARFDTKVTPEDPSLVGAIEADPGQGRVSVDAPVGRALLDATSGEVVEIACPGATRRFAVLSVETPSPSRRKAA